MRSKKSSLLRCKKLWETEVKHATGNKLEMYKLAGFALVDRNRCPACHYAMEQKHYGPCSEHCIIQWPGGWCSSKRSPYHAWHLVQEPREKAAAAQLIVDLCVEALKSLGGKR